MPGGRRRARRGRVDPRASMPRRAATAARPTPARNTRRGDRSAGRPQEKEATCLQRPSARRSRSWSRRSPQSSSAIVSDYRGLTVSDIGKVRRELRDKGITYRVVKNRLAKIAAEQAGRDELASLLDGPTRDRLGGATRLPWRVACSTPLRPFRIVVDPRRASSATPRSTAQAVDPTRHPAPPRGAPGPAGRRHRVAAEHHGVAPVRAAAQPRLRPAAGARAA